MEQSINVSEYLKELDRDDREEIKVRQTAKGSLKGLYHFAKVYIWYKNENRVEERVLVIRRIRNKCKPCSVYYEGSGINAGIY